MKCILIILPFIGAILSRWHGGGFTTNIPKSIHNIAWALPFSLVAYFCNAPIWAWVVCFILCLMGKATGHGRGFRLKEPMEEGAKPERVEALIQWMMPYIPLYAYKVLIMTLTGFAAVSGAVLAFALVSPISATIIAIGGLCKGITAMIFDKNTLAREYADGFLAYLGLAIGAWLIW